MAGLTSAGFVPKTLLEIKAELEAAQAAAFGPSLDVSATSVLGQLNGILAAKLAELWDVAQAVYAAQAPSTASGAALDRIGELTGIYRQSALQTLVTATLTGTNGTVIPAGKQVATSPAGDVFALAESVTISFGSATGVFRAVNYGPVLANAGTLTTIVTPVAGWTGVTNASDATLLGRAEESDEAYRQRRETLLSAAGSATKAAITSAVAAVPGVTSVTVFENSTEVTDGDGLPPHSIEVLVVGGSNSDIAQAVNENKAAGIALVGSVSALAVDESTVLFSRPTTVNIEMTLTYLALAGSVAATVDGQTAVKSAVAAAALAQLAVGDDAYANALAAAAYSVSGVLNVSAAQVRVVSGSYGASAGITSRQQAYLDTSKITVTVTTTSAP